MTQTLVLFIKSINVEKTISIYKESHGSSNMREFHLRWDQTDTQACKKWIFLHKGQKSSKVFS